MEIIVATYIPCDSFLTTHVSSKQGQSHYLLQHINRSIFQVSLRTKLKLLQGFKEKGIPEIFSDFHSNWN